jgi:hypothetical protein
VIDTTEGERRVARAHSGDDAREGLPDRLQVGRQLVVVHQAHDDDALDAARAEDADPALGLQLGIVQPEMIERITELEAAAFATRDVGRDDGR